jgi:hypothetical protein
MLGPKALVGAVITPGSLSDGRKSSGARSVLGPCPSGPVRASSATSGHVRSRRTAGRRPSGSGSCDDANGRFGLWSRRAGVRVPSVTQDRTLGAVRSLPVGVVNHPDRAGHAESVPTTTRRRPDRPGKRSRASVNKDPTRRSEQVKRALVLRRRGVLTLQQPGWHRPEVRITAQ